MLGNRHGNEPYFPLVFTSLLKAGDPTAELEKSGGSITVELGGQCQMLTANFDTYERHGHAVY